ncbi:class I SAM-dependent methyltransferase [Bacteroidota bacterium]
MNKSEKFWNRVSNSFDKHNKKTIQAHIKTVGIIKKYLHDNDIVLDLGCATGAISNDIAGHVKEVHGIDISSKMIEIAKRNADERKIENVNFAQSSIFEEKLKKESFNVILAYNVLHLVEDTQKVLQRINELLKPGGQIISSTACLGEKTLLGKFFIFLSKIGIVPNIKPFKISELEDLITENFQINEAKTFSDNPPNYFCVATKV